MVDESTDRLEQGIEAFLEGLGDSAISASRVIDPLLEIWGLASEIDRSVAEPVESLLTALIGRELTTRDELVKAMDEVRLAAVVRVAPSSV